MVSFMYKVPGIGKFVERKCTLVVTGRLAEVEKQKELINERGLFFWVVVDTLNVVNTTE